MSIALERSGGQADAAGFLRGILCIPVYDLPEIGGERRFPPLGKGKEGIGVANLAAGQEDEDSASCSSSIGRNSDYSWESAGSDGEDSGEPEVQSALKGPLDTMDALEDSLPVRRGISKFYCGKSKSFTTLADVSPSARDLAKPDSAYTRKRKNVLAFCSNWDRRHSDPVGGAGGGGSTSKRLANSGRSTLSPVCGTSSSGSNTTEEHELPRLRPPRHPSCKISPFPCGASPTHRCHLSVRSFSLVDLQGASTCSCSSPGDDMVEGFH